MINSRKKGFTLVELVIVIAVIAILAAVLIPTFSSLVKKANLSADQQAVRQMNTALAMAGNPSDIDAAIDALAEAGYNSEKTLVPVSSGYSFYWYESAKVVVLVKDNTVVYPEGIEYEANGTLLENSIQYINVSAGDTATFSSAIESGIADIKLSADVTTNKALEIKSNTQTNLDLGGKKLSTEMADAAKHYYAFNVYGELTLSNGTIDARGIKVLDGGKLIVKEGVTINHIDDYNGAVIWCDGGEVIIEGGTFVAVNNVSTSPSDGPVVVNVLSGKTTINGGTFISNNKGGYPVICHESGELIINGGTFKGGRGVVSTSGKTTINAGTFETNDSASYALYADMGTVTINGGSFKNTGGYDACIVNTVGGNSSSYFNKVSDTPSVDGHGPGAFYESK